jgi:hypothetical protein
MPYTRLRLPSVKIQKEKSSSFTKTNPYPTPSITSPPSRPKSWIPNPLIVRSRHPGHRLPTTPGVNMGVTSTANPFRRSLLVAQTEFSQLMSLSLFAKNWVEPKEQSESHSAQFLASCRRSGRSPALPYPPHEWQDFTMPVDQPLAKGTSLLCQKGDISILA